MSGQHKARRYGDEWQCHTCGKTWEVSDPKPPTCEIAEGLYTRRATKEGAKKRQIRRRIEEIKEKLALARDY